MNFSDWAYLIPIGFIVVSVIVGVVGKGSKHQQAAWQQFAAAVGGQWTESDAGQYGHGQQVITTVGAATITLSVYSSTGPHSTTSTRMDAPLDTGGSVNTGLDFSFSLRPRNTANQLAQASLGRHASGAFSQHEAVQQLHHQLTGSGTDIATGNAAFDEAFMLRSDEEAKTRTLFTDALLQRRLLALANVNFSLQRPLATTSPQRGAVPQALVLTLEAPGVITDVDRLRSMHAVMSHAVTLLQHL